MTNCRPYWTENEAHWLRTVLAAWFGAPLQLAFVRPEMAWHLWLPGEVRRIVIEADPMTFTAAHSGSPFSLWDGDKEGWCPVLGRALPAPGSISLPVPLIDKQSHGYTIHYDALGLTYWMLSRCEEVGRSDLDAHGRFPAVSSHAFKHSYLERPIVDEWLDILGQIMQRIWPDIELQQRRFDMKVSHDVDDPSRYGFRSRAGLVRAMAGDVLKRGDFVAAMRAPWICARTASQLHPSDPLNTFDWIMDVSERHGLTSAFYFICGRTSPQHDARYEPEHPAIRRLMRSIHDRGHEIGLHPSYNTYRDPDALASEAHRLRAVAEEEGIRQPRWGGRMHYLRWEHPTTMLGWEQAGMDYDTTLGYADHAGFRCGTCFEYPAFDPVAGRMLDLRIRPLIAMECTVMAPRYMGMGTGERAFDKFSQLKDACRTVNGSFTLLWHNSQFQSDAERELYQNVVAH